MVGFFSCTRGVGQGDPLSPLLFCLVEDVLSRGISKLLLEGKISSISGPKHLKTASHVLFAYDIVIFCKGLKRELLCLTSLLQDYALVFGQQVNVAKSRFYTTNDSARKISNIASYMGFSAGTLPFNYLGVPMFIGKPKRSHLQPIADRILAKLTKWKGYVLSIMGRVELVKFVIHSMAIYSFQVYSWHSQLIKHVDKSIRNFIWASNIGVRKITTVAWHKVSLPFKNGGLGIRSLRQLNKAALLKLSWELLASNHEWAIFCRQRFGKSPLKRYFKSSIWSGIKPNWSKTTQNSLFLVGNGHDTNFWTDNWLGDPLVEILQIPEFLHNSLQAKVADFYDGTNWLIPQLLFDKCLQLGARMSQIHPTIDRDNIIWTRTNNEILTLKESYIHLSPISSLPSWCKIIWSNSIPPSKSFTTWRLIHKRMPTNENLMSRGCSMASKCSLCNINAESSEHLFLACPFSTTIWQWLSGIFGIPLNLTSIENMLKACNLHWSPQLKEVLAACIIHSVNIIWFCRNQLRFRGTIISSALAISKIKLATNMSGKAKPPWKLLSRWRHCEFLLKSMICHVSHIYIEDNSCADKLANYGIHSNVFNWWNEAPSFILKEWRRNSLYLPAYRFCNF
ncbi:hypothetical protein Lal_00046022 [Lupinus albus]|nr:hypothetical protein Lal_00046022 [Lupinus albus]